MRPKTILAVVVLTIAVCAHAVGQNSSAPIDRPLWCISAYLGPSTLTGSSPNPWPKLGALGTALPDCVTTWDVVTWPSWEFNLGSNSGTVALSSTSQNVTCTGCPTLTTATTADGTTQLQSAGSGNAYLAVWDTTTNQQQPYFLPIASVQTMNPQIILTANPPISVSNLAYHIYYFSRVTKLFDNAANNNAKVILVWEPTPNQYTANNTDTNCHNHFLNGNGSCYPPSDLTSGTSCATFSGGGGTLVGTGDCQTKLAVADLLNFLKETGRIGTLLGIATGNESNHVPTGQTSSSLSGNGTTATANFSSTCQFVTGQAITVINALPLGFNGSYTVLSPGCNGGMSLTYSNGTSGTASTQGTFTAGDSTASASSDGEWADSIAHHALRAADICSQAKAVYGAVVCGGPGIDKMVTGNGSGTFAGCGQSNFGADWANNWWGSSGIGSPSKMDFFGYHGYFAFLPQAQDYSINSIIATCPNIRAAVQTLPMWDTEHIGGYAGLSSGSMVKVSSLSQTGGTCTANLSQTVYGYSNAPFQNLNWRNGDYIVVAGSNGADTSMSGVSSSQGTGNSQVTWVGCSGTPSASSITFMYNLTLTYGFAAEAFLLQYFRNVAHRPGAIDVVNWEEWINDNAGAQGFALCFGFNSVGYNSSSCMNLTMSGQALGEALKWVRLGGGVKPTSAFQCQFVTAGGVPTSYTCPFQGVMFATGLEANGTQVEVVFFSDLNMHGTTTFTAPSWAQHYLAVDGTCTSVTGGTSSVTLTHAKPIMFTSD